MNESVFGNIRVSSTRSSVGVFVRACVLLCVCAHAPARRMFEGLGPVIKMRLMLEQNFLSVHIKQEISPFVMLGWETGFTSCNESYGQFEWCCTGCMCAQRQRVRILDTGYAALNSAWGIVVCFFVVCVGMGLVTAP